VKVRAEFIRVTNTSILTNITIQLENKDLQFQSKEGVQKAMVNMYARITSMARRVVTYFEEPVSVDCPASCWRYIARASSIYRSRFRCHPGCTA